MGKRSYHQFCILAMALDIIGERWTLLIVRELQDGPKRFTDLQDGLPGIGTNLLSKRLKEMESYDLIRRDRLPPPAASAVYELTENGLALEAITSAIGAWGASAIIGQRVTSETKYFKAGWATLAMRYIYDEEIAKELQGSYEIRVGDEVMHVVIEDGKIDPQFGPAKDPAVVASMDFDTYKAILLQEKPVEELLAEGRITVTGSLKEALRFYQLLVPTIERQFDIKQLEMSAGQQP